MAADWNLIRKEYITGDNITYRDLSAKYHVSSATIAKHAKAEGWAEKRKQTESKTIEKTIEKISEKQAEKRAEDVVCFSDMTNALAAKLAEAIEAADPGDTQGLRRLAASLHDLADLKGYQTDLDRQEQEARIRNLNRQADKEANAVGKIEVVFTAGEDGWNE